MSEEPNALRNPSWSHLPYPALVNILKYLSPTDRFRYSLVCHSWAFAFSDPDLWRQATFSFKDNLFNEDVDRALAFTQRFPNTLSNLQIHIFRNRSAHSKALCDGISIFFENLTGKTFLSTFIFKGNWCLRRIPTPLPCCKSVISAVERFLHTQKFLLHLEINNSELSEEDGMTILKAIASGSGQSLIDMNLTYFFQNRLSMFLNKEYQQSLNQFTNLRTLVLNYNYVSEQIMEIVNQTCQGQLEILHINCHHLEPHRHIISRTIWKKIQKSCSKLKVKFNIDEIVNLRIFSQILPNIVPLQTLRYIAGYTLRTQGDLQTDGAAIVGYINTSFCEVLEQVHLDFGFLKIPSLTIVINNLFQNCKLLRKARLEGVFPIRLAEDACLSALEGKLALKKLRITFHFATYEDSLELSHISLKYRSKLQRRTLDYEFNLVRVD